jgi:HEAT repeat protein
VPQDPRTFLTPDKSPQFASFIMSYFPTSWAEAKEGHADAELESLQGMERQDAERILLAELRGGRHKQAAVRGLGVLRSRAGLEELHRRIKSSPDFDTALALRRIEADPRMLAVISETVRLLDTYPRISAVAELRYVPRPEVVRLLTDCLEDPDYLVRYNAAESLLYLHGLPTDFDRTAAAVKEAMREGKTVISTAARNDPSVRLMSTSPAERETARAELLVAIASRPIRQTVTLGK